MVCELERETGPHNPSSGLIIDGKSLLHAVNETMKMMTDPTMMLVFLPINYLVSEDCEFKPRNVGSSARCEK
jgi:hypothetical protein